MPVSQRIRNAHRPRASPLYPRHLLSPAAHCSCIPTHDAVGLCQGKSCCDALRPQNTTAALLVGPSHSVMYRSVRISWIHLSYTQHVLKILWHASRPLPAELHARLASLTHGSPTGSPCYDNDGGGCACRGCKDLGCGIFQLLGVPFEASHISSPWRRANARAVNAHAVDGTDGVAVGALLVRKRSVQTVIKLLDERSWRKKFAGISRVDDETMAIPLGPDGAKALNAKDLAALPSGLAELMSSDQVQWASGMRISKALKAGTPASSSSSVPSIAISTAVASRPFTFIELFAGLGGFRLGLAALGGRCVFASEIDPHAAAAYARNFGDEHLHGDITSVATSDIPQHDILTAGFPCQSFSRIGHQKGLSDDRGDLFKEILRCASIGRPKALLLENVPNLLRIDETHALHTILSALTSIGYHCRVNVLNAKAFAPQHRDRLFIVGFRADLCGAAAAAAGGCCAERFAWPLMPASRPEGMRSVRDVLEVLLPSSSSSSQEGERSGGPSPVLRLEKYRLTTSQWQVVRSSQEYRHEPSWRLARLNGSARTLRGSYRKSFAQISEFVELDEEGATSLAQVKEDGEEEGGKEGGEGRRRPRRTARRERRPAAAKQWRWRRRGARRRRSGAPAEGARRRHRCPHLLHLASTRSGSVRGCKASQIAIGWRAPSSTTSWATPSTLC